MKKVLRFFVVLLLLIGIAAGGFSASRPDIASQVERMMLFKVANVRWPVALRGVQQNFQKMLLFHEYKMVTNGVFSMFWGNFITRGVVFFEDHIYAGSATNLSVFDARDSRKLVLKKVVPLSGTAYAVSLDRKNKLLYVATGNAGLSILDISVPENTRRIGWMLLPESAYARWLALSYPYVYVASDRGGMIVSVENPRKPHLVKQLLYEPVKFAWVDGNTLYLTLSRQRVYLYDIAKKESPAFISKIDLSYPTSHNEVDPAPGYLITKGPVAYVASGHAGLAVLDVSDRTRPRLLRRISLEGKYSSNVAYYKNVLSVQTSDATFLFDIAKPARPVLLTKQDAYGGFFTAGFSKDRGIYMPRIPGFQVLDVSEKIFPPKVLASYYDKPTARAVYVDEKNKLLYLAHGSDGVKIYDIKNPARPELIRSVSVFGYANGFAPQDSHMFVAEGLRGVSVVNTKVPSRAYTVQTRLDFESISWNLAVDKQYAYVCSGEQGLTVYNIKNPAHPVFIGRSVDAEKSKGKRNDFILNIALRHPYAYLTSVGRVHIYDVSNPRQPVQKKILHGGGGLDLAVQDNIIYVADYNGFIRRIDVSDIQQPVTASFKTGGRPVGLYLNGSRLYVANFDRGIQVYDTAGGKNITLLKTYKTRGNPRDVAVSGHYAYVADWEAGLTVVNLKKDAVL